MGSKDRLQAISAETMDIIERGGYHSPAGEWIDLSGPLELQTRENTYYAPEQSLPNSLTNNSRIVISICDEDAVSAIIRSGTDPEPVCCLVFASARNPGGGFLNGANAQEESLARSSTLPKALLETKQFYEFHRMSRDLRYSDAIIYTPHARVFRDKMLRLLKEPVECAFITAAAPNASAIKTNQARHLGTIPQVFDRRVRRVLRIAAHRGHKRLILGAWGCGVFGNEPRLVASLFSDALNHYRSFEKVTFAIPRAGSINYKIFSDHFSN